VKAPAELQEETSPQGAQRAQRSIHRKGAKPEWFVGGPRVRNSRVIASNHAPWRLSTKASLHDGIAPIANVIELAKDGMIWQYRASSHWQNPATLG
jgi:hypothetical protein